MGMEEEAVRVAAHKEAEQRVLATVVWDAAVDLAWRMHNVNVQGHLQLPLVHSRPPPINLTIHSRPPLLNITIHSRPPPLNLTNPLLPMRLL